MAIMNTYTCADTDGHYLNGVVVVRAKDKEEARSLVDAALIYKNLRPYSERRYNLIEVADGTAVVVFDGDY